MRTRTILFLVALVVVGGAIAYRLTLPRRVNVSTVAVGTAVDAVYASGTIEPVDRAEIKARVAGPLADLNVREGDRVRTGQVLARIAVPSLGFDVARGRADLTAAMRRVQSAPSIALLRAQADALRAQREQSRNDLRRAQQLASTGAVTPQDVERARTALANVQAQLDANQAQQHDAQIQLDADAARQRAGVESLEAHAEDTEVRSPLDGIVLARHVEPGETVGVNQNLLRVGDVRRLQLESQVDEADVRRVQVGMAAAVRLYAMEGQAFSAHVIRISPDADRDRKTYQVDLALDDAIAGLRPGMTAEINIITAEHDHALLTAPDAIHGDRVWVVDEHGRVHARQVRTGIRDLVRVEVISGLRAGDRLVTGDARGLSNGGRVRFVLVPLPSSAPPAIGGGP